VWITRRWFFSRGLQLQSPNSPVCWERPPVVSNRYV